jgi:O-antigen/teichoic acid export membrane protein
VRIPSVVANYLLPVVGVALGWGLPAIFGLVLVSRLVVLIAYLALAATAFGDAPWRPRLRREGLRSMLGFGGWVTVSSVVSPLIQYLDRFLVAGILSMTAVTFYAAPYEVASRLLLIPLSVVMTLYPAFSQLDGSGDRERASRLAARSVKAILLVMAPLALLLIGGAGPGLRVWLGDAFAREAALDAILLFGAAHRLGLLRLAELGHERVVRTASIVVGATTAVMLLALAGDHTALRLAGVGGVVAAVMLLIWRFAMEPAERTRVTSLLRMAQTS